MLLLSHPQKRNVKVIKMFEHVTLFAAGYLRISKHQTWRGRGHNILGQVLGEYRLRMKRRITRGDAYYCTGDRLDNDGHMQPGTAAALSCCNEGSSCQLTII